MPRISITEDNRTGSGGDRFAALKLATDEKALFTMFGEPWGEHIHELRAPILENGVVKMEPRVRKDKTTYEVTAMEFLRNSICLGDTNVLATEGGLDVGNCPACKSAAENSLQGCEKPIQRFASPVVRYKLRGNTWQLQNPFTAEVLVWRITSKKWDELINLQNRVGDLRKVDLTLECEDGDWQRNVLSFNPGDPAWQTFPGAGEYIRALLADRDNLPTDDQMRDACGQVSTRTYMQQDVDLITSRWRQVNNAGAAGVSLPSAPADLAGGIDDLLGGNVAAATLSFATANGGNGLTGAPGTGPGGASAYDPFAMPTQEQASQELLARGAQVLSPQSQAGLANVLGQDAGVDALQQAAAQAAQAQAEQAQQQLAALQAAQAQAQADMATATSPPPFNDQPGIANLPSAAPQQPAAASPLLSFEDVFTMGQ